jgi:hypothetical protein
VTERPQQAFPHLRALIVECQGKKGLAKIAEDAGFPANRLLKYTRTGKNAASTSRMPTGQEILDLAEMLDCKPARVHDALRRDLPDYLFENDHSKEAHELLVAFEAMPPANRRAALELFTECTRITPRDLHAVLAVARALAQL